jgi:hypothetical protein
MRASEDRGAAACAGAAPLVIRRGERAPLGALLLLIALLWLGAALRGLAAGTPAIVPGLGLAGAWLAGALGAALALLALDWLVRGRTVVIGRGTVAVTDRSLLGRRALREPLANYTEIHVDRKVHSHRAGVRTWYTVRLAHPEPARALELARAKDPARIEQQARDWARRLGVPLCTPSYEAPATESARHAERRGEIAARNVAREPLSTG